MQNPQQISGLSQEVDQRTTINVLLEDEEPERAARVWVSRFTGVAGGLCLLFALSLWLARPGHLRPVLALLVLAMFMAILHSYVFEDGSA